VKEQEQPYADSAIRLIPIGIHHQRKIKNKKEVVWGKEQEKQSKAMTSIRPGTGKQTVIDGTRERTRNN